MPPQPKEWRQDLKWFPDKEKSTILVCAFRFEGIRAGRHVLTRARVCVGCDLYIPVPLCPTCCEPALKRKETRIEFYYVRTKGEVKRGVPRRFGAILIKICKKCIKEVTADAVPVPPTTHPTQV